MENIVKLVKPGIIMGNAITAASGFVLASKGHFDLSLFLMTLLGLSLIIASGCAFNNYIDRDADKKMTRTQDRVLARGALSNPIALLYAGILGIAGTWLLFVFVHPLPGAIALAGFAIYVLLYSLLKYRTTHATLIGSIAGAVPPVVGYTAVTHQLDLGALLLFAMIALWQMPHFYAIAIYRLEEYAAASIPVLPVKEGIQKTKVQMVVYAAAFFISALLPALCGYAGKVYLISAALLGAIWLIMSIQGFKAGNDKQWARKMFLFSLIIVTGLSAVIIVF